MEQARASAGWSAPYGFATVKGISLDVVPFLRESQSVFRAMGSFETGLVAESEVRELKQQRAIEWKDVAARSMAWAIGEQSSSLKRVSPSCCTPPRQLEQQQQRSRVTPSLRQTFGSISLVHLLLRPPHSHLPALRRQVARPGSSPATYLIGSATLPPPLPPSDQAPEHSRRLPALPARPPQLIRLDLVLSP